MAPVWFARAAFIVFSLVAYMYQRQLEEKREAVKLLESDPDLMIDHEWWTIELKPRKARANRLRNLRDLALGLATLSFLIDLWLI